MTSELLDPSRKVLAPSALEPWRRHLSGRLVFTNGVFDLLHPGHVQLLAEARAAGDCLIVALNTDASVRRLGKGADRPIRALEDRAYVVAGLESVDAVTWFDEDTPLELVRVLRPHVLVKGGDYDPRTVVGGDDVRSWGGEVRIVPLVPGQSTTSIVSRLRASQSPY